MRTDRPPFPTLGHVSSPVVPLADGGRTGGHRSRRPAPALPAVPASVLDAFPSPTALLDSEKSEAKRS
ncbi:hypothetical protein GCM10023162_36360 [Klenkia terrae]